MKEAGLEARIALKSGDFNRDSLGGPYDVVLMSDILHYQDLATNAALVKKIYGHLNPRGPVGHQRSIFGCVRHQPRLDGGICRPYPRQYGTRRLLSNGRSHAVDA